MTHSDQRGEGSKKRDRRDSRASPQDIPLFLLPSFSDHAQDSGPPGERLHSDLSFGHISVGGQGVLFHLPGPAGTQRDGNLAAGAEGV